MFEWLEGSLGGATALIVYFGLAFVGILVAFFLLRWLWQHWKGSTYVHGDKNRKRRLSVIDATIIDNRRRLVLVRRDDTEHLVLIGGMNDVVIERDIAAHQNIRSESPATKPALDDAVSKIETKNTEPGSSVKVVATSLAPKARSPKTADPVTPTPKPRAITPREDTARIDTPEIDVPQPVSPRPTPATEPVRPALDKVAPPVVEKPVVTPTAAPYQAAASTVPEINDAVRQPTPIVPSVQPAPKAAPAAVHASAVPTVNEDDLTAEIEDEMRELLDQLTDEAKVS